MIVSCSLSLVLALVKSVEVLPIEVAGTRVFAVDTLLLLGVLVAAFDSVANETGIDVDGV